MDAILKRAIERQQAKSEGIGHEELVEAAGELGIPREVVEAAARELAAEKAGRAPPPPLLARNPHLAYFVAVPGAHRSARPASAVARGAGGRGLPSAS